MLARMSVRREVRASDSPLVERITRVRFETAWRGVTTPDGCWDIVVRRVGGRGELLQTGLITKPVELAYDAGDEYLSISFKPGVFMPRLPGKRMVDRGVLRPTPSPRTFWLEQEKLEIPTFENAEALVARLVRRELLVRDEIVEGVVEGRPRAIHPRSVQRHFLEAMGVTAKRLEQIRRACRAVELLTRGKRAVDVALELGYSDQAHMTRSLKAIMGKTPSAVARD
jgi:Helix-turn-helix domain